jgi:hypothetical protein
LPLLHFLPPTCWTTTPTRLSVANSAAGRVDAWSSTQTPPRRFPACPRARACLPVMPPSESEPEAARGVARHVGQGRGAVATPRRRRCGSGGSGTTPGRRSGGCASPRRPSTRPGFAPSTAGRRSAHLERRECRRRTRSCATPRARSLRMRHVLILEFFDAWMILNRLDALGLCCA